MFIAQIRCSDEASYSRDVLPSPRTTSVRAEVTLEPELVVVFRALPQLQLAEVHLRHPEVVPCSSLGLGLSELAGSREEEPAVHPHGARSQVGSRGSQPALGMGQPSAQPLHVTQVLPLPPSLASLGSALAWADSDGSPSSSSLANLG